MTRLTTLALGLGLAAGPLLADGHSDSTPFLSIGESAEFGEILVGPNGEPVYAFYTDLPAGDGQAPITSCNAPCQVDWPLAVAPGEVAVSDRLDADLATTITWEGQEVAMYNSQVLFYFYQDIEAEEPQGQEIHSYGGWWYLLDPRGEPIVTGIAPVPNANG